VPMWRRLSHENILPFLGVTMTVFQLALVYDWGHNGNITQYIASHPHASRASLLLDVTKGLAYLHSLGLPHGDLKGANVLIDQKGRACLTEYGLAPIISDPSFTVAATPGAVGTSRWLAPEIIIPPRKGATMPIMESKPADVFAFAMFAVEVFTGKIPFEEQKNEAVVLRISRGGRPEMPINAEAVGLTPEMWKVLESCWQQVPKKRPTMEEVVRRWQRLVENGSGNGVAPEEPPPAAGSSGTGRTRLKTEAVRPRAKPDEPTRRRVMSEVTPSQAKSENYRLRPLSTVQQETKSEAVQQIQQGRASQVTRPKTEPSAPRPNVGAPKRKKRWWACGLF